MADVPKDIAPKMLTLQDLLDEITARDEAIENLVIQYFQLEAKHKQLQAKYDELQGVTRLEAALDQGTKLYKADGRLH